MRIIFLLSIALLLCVIQTKAQDISGKWIGVLSQTPGGFTKSYYFEMNLKQNGDVISGTSLIGVGEKEKGFTHYGLMSIRGTFDGAHFFYEDLKILNQKGLTDSMAWCIKKCEFKLEKEGDHYKLEGHWTGSSAFGYCSPGTIKVSKAKVKDGTVADKEEKEGIADNKREVLIKVRDDKGAAIKAQVEVKRKGRGEQKLRVDKEATITLDEGKYHLIGKESGFYDVSEDLVINAENNLIEVILTLKKIREGDRFEIENLQFERSKATISQESKEILDKLVEFLKVNHQVSINIGGHTDNVGSKYLNRLLSYNRANSVMSYLVKNGISQKRLMAKGHGSELPIADNNTTEGRAKNRRVEITITKL